MLTLFVHQKAKEFKGRRCYEKRNRRIEGREIERWRQLTKVSRRLRLAMESGRSLHEMGKKYKFTQPKKGKNRKSLAQTRRRTKEIKKRRANYIGTFSYIVRLEERTTLSWKTTCVESYRDDNDDIVNLKWTRDFLLAPSTSRQIKIPNGVAMNEPIIHADIIEESKVMGRMSRNRTRKRHNSHHLRVTRSFRLLFEKCYVSPHHLQCSYTPCVCLLIHIS